MARRVASPSPPSVEQPVKPLVAAPIRHALAIFTFAAAGWGGLHAGNWLVYAIARWTDRDIAELKVMLIWGTLAGALLGLLLVGLLVVGAYVWAVLR